MGDNVGRREFEIRRRSLIHEKMFTFAAVKNVADTYTDADDEAKLIRDLKQGSVSAFTVIYHRYFQRIYVYCLQFTKSQQEAEDIVQEVFVQLWCNRSKITTEHSLKSLIYVIARNFLVKVYRQNINAPIFEDYIAYCNTFGECDRLAIEYNEFLSAVERFVSELPTAQQQVVRLSKFDQFSNKEIAQRLGINEQSVKNYLSKGLKYLRQKMKSILIIVILMFH